MPTISASHAPATGREAGRTALASIARASLRCVAHDLGLGVIQALAGKLDIVTALQADRALRATQAEAQLVIRDLRQVQFVEQFPSTNVQEVPV